MFTGLVEDVGKLSSRMRRGPGARLRIETRLAPLVMGESISVMGVCLTVDAIWSGGFEADSSLETLERTTLEDLQSEPVCTSNAQLLWADGSVAISFLGTWMAPRD